MAGFLKSNGKEKNRRKSHYDEYRAAVSQLDEKTKNKLELQRTLGMAAIVLIAIGLFCILVFTGIGVDKTKSRSGNYFVDLEKVRIECFGDSITEGYTSLSNGKSGIGEITYPNELEKILLELFRNDGRQYRCNSLEIKNYGQSGSILVENSSSRLSGTANIVLMMYTANNFIEGIEYEGALDTNINSILSKGSTLFLLNYPIPEGSKYSEKLEQANNYIASTASQRNIQFIDLCSYFSSVTEYSQDELFCADGIHPTELGYKIMGDYIAEVIHSYYYEMV